MYMEEKFLAPVDSFSLQFRCNSLWTILCLYYKWYSRISLGEERNLNNRDKFKITILLKEYSRITYDARTNWMLWVVCITLSILVFSLMLVAAVIYDKYILLLVSPALSLFFGLMALAILGMILNSLLRINEIADNLNQILDQTVMKWESSGWIPNMMVTNVVRYVNIISFFAIVVAAAPIVISLGVGLTWLVDDGREWFNKNDLSWFHPVVSWAIPIAYGLASALTIRLGIGLGVKRYWENMKVDVDVGEQTR
jgi:hypothetical protein